MKNYTPRLDTLKMLIIQEYAVSAQLEIIHNQAMELSSQGYPAPVKEIASLEQSLQGIANQIQTMYEDLFNTIPGKSTEDLDSEFRKYSGGH